jgi:uncharacterized membrane protein
MNTMPQDLIPYAYLLLGLVLFLGVHSLRVFAEPLRTQAIGRWGEGVFKGVYSLASLAGLVLIIWAFAWVREQPLVLWSPPTGLRHAASLLTLFSFVLFAAAYVPGNALRIRLGHPMAAGVKLWALAHLLSNGTLAHVMLFGGFLVWGVLSFTSARRRDRLAQTGFASQAVASAKSSSAVVGLTAVTVVLGVALWALFAFYLHGVLIGIRPFG